MNAEQINVSVSKSESQFKFTELKMDRNKLKDQVAELQHRLNNIENRGDLSLSKRLEMLLELEPAARAHRRHDDSRIYKKIDNGKNLVLKQ
ncbi:GH24582 [Drosophila grimshawi]|uniref:GH24582 n=1 Tax=Drosophila grimshawi TaxID=7222 RepID=B4JM56_DROGR|nr:GH24582 [Drosophila grimshawi]